VRNEQERDNGTWTNPSTGRVSRAVACFQDWRFDLLSLELSRSGLRIPLEPQPAKVLRELISADGACVDRDTLIRAVWNGRHAEHDQGLNYCIRRIRAALLDDAAAPQYVETLSRRGYRFKAPVHPEPVHKAPVDVTPLPSPRVDTYHRRRRWAVAAVVGVASLTALFNPWRTRSTGSAASNTSPMAAHEWRDEAAVAATLPAPERLSYLMVRRWLRTRAHPGYAVVLATIDSVLGAHPSFVPGRLARAEALIWIDSTLSARALLDSIVAEAPREAEAHLLSTALSLFREADTTRAASDIARALQLAPTNSAALHYAAYVDIVRRDATAARRHIAEALRHDPLSPTLNGDAGMVLYYLGDLARADSLCARGMRADPGAVAPVFCRMLVSAARNDRSNIEAFAAEHAIRSHEPGAVRTAGTFEHYARVVAKRYAPQRGRRSVSGLSHLRWLALLGDTAEVRRSAAALTSSTDPSRVWLRHDLVLSRYLTPSSPPAQHEAP
jgi:DNA-binding winged helix-turn-helix (wHTH) protein